MAKFSFGDGGFQGFMARHVEKFVFGVVVLTFLALVWFGVSKEAFTKTPDQLASAADQAVQKVNDNTSWSRIGDTYQPKVAYSQKVPEGRIKTDAGDYPLPSPWSPQLARPRIKREDPKLLAPLAPETFAMTAALAIKATEDDLTAPSAWDNDKDMTLSDDQKKMVKKKEPKKSARMGAMSGMMPGMKSSGMDEMMGMGMGMGPEMGDMMSGMAGMGGASTLARGVRGYRPGTFAKAEESHIVAVKFLAPFEEQVAEYEKVLATAMGYDPRRDRPRYVSFRAQRADVTDDPDKELTDADWDPKWRMNPNVFPQLWANWHGAPPEVNDPRYLELGLLTMPIPPVMMDDYEGLATHTEIPLLTAQPLMPAPTGERTDSQSPKETTDDEIPGLASTTQPGAPGAGPGSMPGMPGAMPGMPGGMGMGMGGDYASAMSAAGGMGMGMGAGMGMEGMMGMEGSALPPAVKYKLIRFYDFFAQPGRKYRYRVQLVVEDPNHPQFPQMEPTKRSLSDAVLQRLTDVATKETKDRRVFYVSTPWSEPTDVVSVELPSRVLAGTVTPPKSTKVPGVGDLSLGDPVGKVMAVAWEPSRAVKVPGIKDVLRGTFLNFTDKVNVAHPVTLVFKTIENFEFSVNSLVLDMRGGDELAGITDKDSKPLQVPSEMILVDANGNLIVRNELDDSAEYKGYLPPEKEQPAMSGGMMDAGDAGMINYPGAGAGDAKPAKGRGARGGN